MFAAVEGRNNRPTNPNGQNDEAGRHLSATISKLGSIRNYGSPSILPEGKSSPGDLARSFG